MLYNVIMDIPTVDEVLELLKDVIDLEIGINIVDLGLVYDVVFPGDRVITVKMTLTSPACPLQDVIEDQVQSVLINHCSRIIFDWVWVPGWNTSMITDDGRDQLRAVGFNSF